MISKGSHEIRVVRAELTDDKSGDMQVHLRLQRVDNTSEESSWFLGFKTPKAEEFSLKTMRELGCVKADFNKLTASDFPNTRIVLFAEETYNGKTSVKPKWVEGGPQVRPLSASKAELFAEKLNAKQALYIEQVPPPPPAKGEEELPI